MQITCHSELIILQGLPQCLKNVYITFNTFSCTNSCVATLSTGFKILSMVVYLSWESESQSSNVDMTSYVEVAICKNIDWY